MKKLFKAISVFAVVALLVATMALALAACDPADKSGKTLRFAAPDGTPALAMLRLPYDNSSIGDYNMEYEVVKPANIASEMTTGKSDVLIMPINAGAAQIANNGLDYKLVSVAVEGSLYLVGHKDVAGKITFEDIKGKKIACIGQTGVPGLVFKYVMEANDIDIVTSGTPTENQVFVEYVAEGTDAISRYYGKQVDFIVVGEPAATAQQTLSKTFAETDDRYERRLNSEMDMQEEYGKKSGLAGVDNYPQAGLFVKTELTKNAAFMSALFAALDANKEWIEQNASKVTEVAKSIGSTSTFPPTAIPRCPIDCDGLDADDVTEIVNFLSKVAPAVKWNEKKDAIFFMSNY